MSVWQKAHMKHAALFGFLALATFASAQTTPSKEQILATQAAIQKKAESPYDVYNSVVPTYVTKDGELTEEGKTATGLTDATPPAVAEATPAATPPPAVPEPTPAPVATTTPALPAKSSISLKETTSEIPAPTPAKGKKCKIAHHLTTVTPTVIVGADAEGAVTWKLYAGVKSPKSKGLTLVSLKTLNPGEPTEVAPVVADAGEWECSCCRPLNKTFPRLVGWYGELTDSTGKILATVKAGASGGFEMADFVESKQEFPGSTGNLQFKSEDAPKGQTAVAAAPITPVHFALASKSKFDGSVKMKGPSNRTFYVDPSPLLVRADYESVGASSQMNSSKTYAVNVHLSQVGIAKFKAVNVPPDGMVVVVQGDQLIADELVFNDDRKSIMIKGRLSSDEFDELANTLRANPVRPAQDSR